MKRALLSECSEGEKRFVVINIFTARDSYREGREESERISLIALRPLGRASVVGLVLLSCRLSRLFRLSGIALPGARATSQ